MLTLQPVTQKKAFAFIREHHRHHKPPAGSLFQVAVSDGSQIVGVAIVGRPEARKLQDGFTAEVTRLCTIENAPKNAAGKLCAAAWRAARALGYTLLVTYTLESETGTSIKAVGWRELGKCGGRSWNRPSRPRVDKHPIGPKRRFQIAA